MRGVFHADGRLLMYTRDGWSIGWERIVESGANGGHTHDLRHAGEWRHSYSTEFRELTEEEGLQIVDDYASWYAQEKWPTPEIPVRFIMPSGRVVTVPFR